MKFSIDGELFKGGDPVSDEDKKQVASDAANGIKTIVPDSLKKFLGHEFVELRLLKLHRFFQMEPLVQHLAFNLLEKMISHVIRQKPRKPKSNRNIGFNLNPIFDNKKMS